MFAYLAFTKFATCLLHPLNKYSLKVGLIAPFLSERVLPKPHEQFLPSLANAWSKLAGLAVSVVSVPWPRSSRR